MEGYVAFLPIALVFLLLTFLFGRHYVFWWSHEAAPNPEKATYFSAGFLIGRDLLTFALMTALGVWYIYRSL
jgi:hypothetical protein